MDGGASEAHIVIVRMRELDYCSFPDSRAGEGKRIQNYGRIASDNNENQPNPLTNLAHRGHEQP